LGYALWSGEKSRKIVSRIVVEGDLILQTPAHFGNGDTDELVDMPLLVDPLDGRTPLLTGASIAGALRSYLRERELGYRGTESRYSASTLLFGTCREKEGEQSPLIVEDTLGKSFGVEIRNGVVLDPKSRTALEGKLFDLQLWSAGTTFPLRFELAIREDDDEIALKKALATALEGFNSGSVTLGARKRRGYGRVRVLGWRVKNFELTTPEGLLDWIGNGDKPLEDVNRVKDIKMALGMDELLPDKRRFFHLESTFFLKDSLLIRSGGGQDDRGSDMVHLHARQADGRIKPILSGTSLAGALRARAFKIASTLGGRDRARSLINEMFGPETDSQGMELRDDPKASHIVVYETVIENARTDLAQNRVSIDRFTGGARESALFNEQPVFGGDNTILMLEMRLLNPQVYEIGLLLLLLKDLWTGDLPLGGEIGIGRGRLKGIRTVLTLHQDGSPQEWKIVANGLDLMIDGDRNILEQFVSALTNFLKEGCYETRD